MTIDECLRVLTSFHLYLALVAPSSDVYFQSSVKKFVITFAINPAAPMPKFTHTR